MGLDWDEIHESEREWQHVKSETLRKFREAGIGVPAAFEKPSLSGFMSEDRQEMIGQLKEATYAFANRQLASRLGLADYATEEQVRQKISDLDAQNPGSVMAISYEVNEQVEQRFSELYNFRLF